MEFDYRDGVSSKVVEVSYRLERLGDVRQPPGVIFDQGHDRVVGLGVPVFIDVDLVTLYTCPRTPNKFIIFILFD